MGAPGGGGQDDKNSMQLLWTIGILFVMALVIWHFFGYWLQLAFIEVRLAEARAISFLGGNIGITLHLLENLHPADLSFEVAAYVSNEVGYYLMIPTVGAIAFMALIIWRGNVITRFRRSHGMKSLALQEAENWPQIAPVVNLDLVSQDVQAGPWAMAMNPIQFCRKYQLVDVERLPDTRTPWKLSDNFSAKLRKQAAQRVFAGQMGHLWEGLNRLPKYTRALFAVFAARMNHDTVPARALLLQLSATAGKGDINYTGTQALLKKHFKSKPVQRCLQSHAYVYTVMATMLTLCRTDGVQATCDFLWLKPVDRRLWYVLNCVGRQTVFPEVAGPFAHWIAEKQLGRPLNVPMVEQACAALERALSMTLYVPNETEETTLNKGGSLPEGVVIDPQDFGED